MFHLEVTDKHINETERVVFYKLETVFFIQEEYYLLDGNIYDSSEPDEEYTRNDFTVTGEYDIMFRDGSLWYVENAPDFDRLDEGDTTMMMASPVASGGDMNLKLFKYPGVYNGFTWGEEVLLSYGNNTDNRSHYAFDSAHLGYPPYRNDNALISKSRGLDYLHILETWGGGSFIFHYRLNINFDLIE